MWGPKTPVILVFTGLFPLSFVAHTVFNGDHDVGSECKIALNLKTYIWFEGKLYCQKHRPVARASTGADSVSAIHAKSTLFYNDHRKVFDEFFVLSPP